MFDVWWVGDRQSSNCKWLRIAVVVECEFWKKEGEDEKDCGLA